MVLPAMVYPAKPRETILFISAASAVSGGAILEAEQVGEREVS